MENEPKRLWWRSSAHWAAIAAGGVAVVALAGGGESAPAPVESTAQPAAVEAALQSEETQVQDAPQAEKAYSQGTYYSQGEYYSQGSYEPAAVPLSNDNYYTNSAGNQVHSPAYAPAVPAGASARCRDGTYSFSQSRRGTCSHHGGVAEWL